ncbi:unnamed protein product [Cylicocyclus nassatus]|uniref:Uncharacterized protein n=1 Tax=Cylicocyclus nassatus TaxID=53992 RepID=A0AA36GJK7_CYLNA|nr:unnamed protein product [Cylicocyclus nassatus]
MRDQYKKIHGKLISDSEAPTNFQRQKIMALLQIVETTMQVPGTRFSNLGPTNNAAVDLAPTNDAAVDDDIFIDKDDPPSQGTSFPQSPSQAPLDDFSPFPTKTASFMKSERTPLAPVDVGRRYLGKRKYPYTSKSDKASGSICLTFSLFLSIRFDLAIEAVHKATDAVREQLQEMKTPIDEYYHFGWCFYTISGGYVLHSPSSENYVSQTLRSLTKALAHEMMALIAQLFAYDDITFSTAKPDPTQQGGIDLHYEMTEPGGSQMTEGNLEYSEYVQPKKAPNSHITVPEYALMLLLRQLRLSLFFV